MTVAVSLCPTFGIGWQGFTAAGIPLNAGLIYCYQAGGTTPQDTYTTSAGSVKNANPIVLAADGRPPNEIWLISGQTYRFDLKDSLGNLIKTYDNVSGINDVTASNINITGQGTYAIARSLTNWGHDWIKSTDYYNLDGTQVGAFPGTQDDTTGLNRFFAELQTLGDGACGLLVPLPGSGYKVTAQLTLPNTNGWQIWGNGAKIIFAPTVASTDCLVSGNVWASSSNYAQLLDVFVYTASSNARYGINWTALNRSRIRAHCQGFSATNAAGFFTNDCIIVEANLTLNYNYYGLLQDSTHANSPMNAWDLKVSLENNTRAARIYEANGIDIDVLASESNSAGIDVRKGSGVNIGAGIGAYLGEGNASYDIQLGADAAIHGAHVSGTVNSISTLGGVQTPHYPVALYNVEGFTHNCQLANGSAFIDFALSGGVSNSYFGPLALSASVSGGDPSYSTPVNNPPGPLAGGCTYKGLGGDPGILTRGNIFADYNTFVCSGGNLVQWDMPLGEFVMGGTGTSSFTRSPNTGTVPDRMSGRPVGLYTKVNDGTGHNITATFPITVADGVQNKMVTFAIDIEIPAGTGVVWNMSIDNGAGGNVATVSYQNANGTTPKTYYVSGYMPAITTLRCWLDGFTATAVYKFSNPRVFVGMDPRTCPGLSGDPNFQANTVPTTGTFAVGERVTKANVAAGGSPGWYCTTAGTGGGALVFKAEGNIVA